MYPTRRPKTANALAMEREAMAASREGGDATTKSRHRPKAASTTAQTTKTAHIGAADNRSRTSRQRRAAVDDDDDDDDDASSPPRFIVSFASDEDTRRRRVAAVNAHPNAAGAASAPTFEKNSTALYPHPGTTSANAEYVYTANASNAVGASLYKNTHAAHLTYSTSTTAAAASLAVAPRLAASPPRARLPSASSPSTTNTHATTAAATVHTALTRIAPLARIITIATALANSPAQLPAVRADIARACPAAARLRAPPPLRSATCPSNAAYACAAPTLPKPPQTYTANRVLAALIPKALAAAVAHPAHACAPRRRAPRPRSLAHAHAGFAIADAKKMKA